MPELAGKVWLFLLLQFYTSHLIQCFMDPLNKKTAESGPSSSPYWLVDTLLQWREGLRLTMTASLSLKKKGWTSCGGWDSVTTPAILTTAPHTLPPGLSDLVRPDPHRAPSQRCLELIMQVVINWFQPPPLSIIYNLSSWDPTKNTLNNFF